MSGKTGKRITGKKPANSTRTSAKPEGAFGKQGPDQLVEGVERNMDRAVAKQNLKTGKR